VAPVLRLERLPRTPTRGSAAHGSHHVLPQNSSLSSLLCRSQLQNFPTRSSNTVVAGAAAPPIGQPARNARSRHRSGPPNLVNLTASPGPTFLQPSLCHISSAVGLYCRCDAFPWPLPADCLRGTELPRTAGGGDATHGGRWKRRGVAACTSHSNRAGPPLLPPDRRKRRSAALQTRCPAERWYVVCYRRRLGLLHTEARAATHAGQVCYTRWPGMLHTVAGSAKHGARGCYRRRPALLHT
jgi:hypothetical protein